MKKSFAAGLFAVGLIATGATGFYMANAKEKYEDPVYFMQQRMGSTQMMQMMNPTNTVNPANAVQQTPNQNSTFKQMLPYMKKMHPNLTDEQLKALYDQMMGPNGACTNAQGMMGNINKSNL